MINNFESEVQFKELYVGNLPYLANAQNVTSIIESVFLRRGRCVEVLRCELKQENSLKNKGYGFILLKSEDANELLSILKFTQIKYLGRTLDIKSARNKRNRKVKIDDSPKDEFVFQVANLEMGNWAGQPQSKEDKKKKRGKKKHQTTERWLFTKDWEYPDEFLKPRLIISGNAFLLEGFSTCDGDKRRVQIPFRMLDGRKGVIFDPRENTLSVYLSIKHPPRLYQKTDNSMLNKPRSRFLVVRTMEESFIRTIDWTGNINAFGKCLVYRLVFTNSIEEIKNYLKKGAIPGISRNIPYVTIEQKEVPILPPTYLDEIFDSLPFLLQFKLECLISHGIITPNEIYDRRLGDQLAELVREGNEQIAWHALNQITTQQWDPSDDYYNNQRPIDIFKIAVKNFRGKHKGWHPNIVMKNIARGAWVNHATITPTKIYLDGPTYEPSNRILRQYNRHLDRFMRVTFCDEDFDRLFVNIQEHKICKERIEFIMNNGFKVGGRHYEFLAFSSSQLRESACWFVSPYASADSEFNAHKIRSQMGDFSTIKSPALYAARMGQCFSSTIGTIELDKSQVKEIDDIKSNDNDVFSDGCGTISKSLAKRVTKFYWGSSRKGEEVPSVFQIRFGGVKRKFCDSEIHLNEQSNKGVVSVDPNLQGDVLCIRPSQTKFDAPVSRNLEICKTVRNPLVGHLNRQIIIILESLGVPSDVFTGLQDSMRKDIDLMTENEDKARDVVNRSLGSRECSHVTRTILSMIEEGMMRTEEPFLRGLLECKRIFALKSLRYKARILMPNSFLLFGILDETGTLEAGQIFVQTSTIVSKSQTFSNMNEKVERVHKVHQGKADIQIVTAVDVPQLSHLYNCVVFSQKGDRPLPNCLSGGDLDGDEYFVCFDERIFFDGTERPMNYKAPERKILDRPVEISDVCEFFTDFMINNRLGQIANLHLAFADYEAEGVRSEKCLELAQQHSKAVDFNKTGVPVTGSLPPIPQYPDFMENNQKDSYKSEKILGKLYRRIKLERPDKDRLLNYKVKGGIKPMRYFRVEGFREHVEEAVIQRNAYNLEIRTLMKKYGVKTEPEIITSNILGLRRINGRKGQDIREEISATVSEIIYNFRKIFLMGLRGNEDAEAPDEETHFSYHVPIPINEETKVKAAAWYMVAYDETYDEEDVDWNEIRLLSFPWVVADILLAIRSENWNKGDSEEYKSGEVDVTNAATVNPGIETSDPSKLNQPGSLRTDNKKRPSGKRLIFRLAIFFASFGALAFMAGAPSVSISSRETTAEMVKLKANAN
ncbi:7262_t:CDS:10 [Acaulospora colombiana]|uniref:7262_t:CDS:1 n=1 Tax=Acaulospora colombiana TaxID=27376 RepID=A0ACA9KIU7_9GLOM|nr:7262_t:CDS:10 [Acaulospora colombiana]